MKKLNKHMERIAKSNIREALECVHYSKEFNVIEATDCFRLLRVKSENTIEKELLLNPRTLEFSNHNYPDTERLVPSVDNHKVSIYNFNAQNIKKLKEIKAIEKKESKKIQIISLVYKDGSIFLSSKNSIDFMELKCVESDKSTNKAYINIDFIIELFDFIKDLSNEYKDETTIDISLTSRVRPLNFSNDKFDYLVTPFRLPDIESF